MLITEHLSEHHLLSNCLWGFQPKKSTVSALITTTKVWLQLLEAGQEIGAVFFDFTKAFDRVPHEPLLSKLATLDLDPYIFTWLRNSLTYRRQYVVVNGSMSVSSRVTSGDPQGSILNPLIFLI